MSCIDKIIGNAVLIVKKDGPETLTQRWKEYTIGRVGMEPLHPWELSPGAGALRARDVFRNSFCIELDSDALAANIIESCGPQTGKPVLYKRRREDETQDDILRSKKAVKELLLAVRSY